MCFIAFSEFDLSQPSDVLYGLRYILKSPLVPVPDRHVLADVIVLFLTNKHNVASGPVVLLAES